jgi:hypothetical protein
MSVNRVLAGVAVADIEAAECADLGALTARTRIHPGRGFAGIDPHAQAFALPWPGPYIRG